MMENVKRHPEHERRIYSRSEENGNTSAEVIDSSHKAFLPPFRMTILGKHVTNNGERKAS